MSLLTLTLIYVKFHMLINVMHSLHLLYLYTLIICCFFSVECCTYIQEAVRITCGDGAITDSESCNELNCCWDDNASSERLKCYQKSKVLWMLLNMFCV